MGLEHNHGMTYRSLLHVSSPVNHHSRWGKVGLVMGAALGLLTLLVITPLLGRRGASIVSCGLRISPLLFKEVRGLTFLFYRRYFVCNMGLIWAAPTAMVEFGQDGCSDRVKRHVCHWSACLHVVSSHMIPFIRNHSTKSFPACMLRQGHCSPIGIQNGFGGVTTSDD